MKNIIQKSFIVLALLGAMGCGDDFFDKSPQGSIDSSKINAELFVQLRNNIYSQIPDGYGEIFLDGYADNGYSRNAWDSNGSAVQNNTLDGGLNFGYAGYFQSIRACNQVIKKADDYPEIPINDREKYKAEARVMRAWLYGIASLYFGDIALSTDVSNDFPDGLPRNPASEVRTWVLKELDEAIAILPQTNDKGYFNKAMATAIKARMAYYFGKYDQAEVAARYVIDNGGYRLHQVASLSADMVKDGEYFKKFVDFSAYGINEDTFIKGLFNYQDIWKADNSPETIIAKEYIANPQNNSWVRVTCLLTPNLVEKQAWATIVPTQELVDAYWTTDGKTKPTLSTMDQRIKDYKALADEIKGIENTNKKTFNEAVNSIENSLPNKAYLSQFKNRDSRLYASIIFPYSAVNKYRPNEYQHYVPEVNNYGESGYAFRKMSGADDVIPISGGAYYGTGVDFPVIRLAEMLLIYAEAHTQNTGYDGTVVVELNKLRTRAGMPEVPTGLSKNDALDFIRKERRIELAGEGLRFFDIRLYEDDTRNGGFKGTEAASVVMRGQIKDVVGKLGAKKIWAPRLMYMPLPTTALDKNKNAGMKQNPGY